MGQDVRVIMADRGFSSSSENEKAKREEAVEDVAQRTFSFPSEPRGTHSHHPATERRDESFHRTVESDVFQTMDTTSSGCETPLSFQYYGQTRSPVALSGSEGRRGGGRGGKADFDTREIAPRVPNIVVEHVLSREGRGPGQTAPFSVPALSPVVSSRQIRALSDSSVHELHSFYIPSPPMIVGEPLHLQPRTAQSLTDVGERDRGSAVFREKVSPSDGGSERQTMLSVHGGGLRRCKTSRLSAVIEPVQGDVEGHEVGESGLPIVPCQLHLHSHRTHSGQGKSPKTYWMRRHSDSNLTSRHGSTLRTEPYPIRSRSTGDSIPSPAVLPEPRAVADTGQATREEPDTGVAGPADKQPSEERSGGLLYEKRLKLKKYLQTRYQTGLEMRQSSDADDVFTDRALDPYSPTLPVSPEPLQMHINIPPISPAAVQEGRSTCTTHEEFVCEKRQKLGRKGLSKSGRVYDMSCDTPEPIDYSDGRLRSGKGEVLSSATTCRSDVPVFVFPTVSPASRSDPSSSPSWLGQHSPQLLVSSGVLVPHLGVAEQPLMTSWHSSTFSDMPRTVTSAAEGFSSRRLCGDVSPSQAGFLKQPEMHGRYSNFPVPLDLPVEKRKGYLRCLPWEVPDNQAQMSPLARPQSYGNLMTYSSISDSSLLPLARFPSTPVLSDCPSASAGVPGRRESGESSPLRVSRPSMTLASTLTDQRSFEGRQLHSPACESGVGREEPAMTQSQFSCPLCGQEFCSYNSLATHMSGHLPSEGTLKDSTTEGLKVHLCRICNRVFSRSDMLTRHTRLHTGLRPYECHLCGQVFSRSDHLHTHLRTHTGEKPYKCTNCPYAAPRRDMVTRHMRIHTRDVRPRGRRSSSLSVDVPISPLYTGLSTDEVHRRIQSLSSVDPVTAPSASTRDSSLSTSVEATDVELGFLRRAPSRRTGSLTSCESTEGSDVSHAFPTYRTWSSTSTESFESFSSPRTRDQLSWSSSTDSPDVFSRTPQQFFWSVRAASCRPEKGHTLSSTVDTLSKEMQTSFERCTVTTPEHESRDDAGEKKHGEGDKLTDVRIKTEREFDPDVEEDL